MAALLVVAVVVRIPLFPHVAYMAPNPVPFSDTAVWAVWSRSLWEHGLADLSHIEPRTYVGYHYVLWVVGQVYALMSPDFELGTDRLLYLLKIPPVLFDLLLVPLIYLATKWACRLQPDCEQAARQLAPVAWLENRGLPAQDSLGLFAGALFVLSPGVIYDSAVWAQSDSMITFFMLASILMLASGRVGPAWALWVLAFVVKPQPVVIIPALAAFTLWRFGWAGVVRGAFGVAAGGFASFGYLMVMGNGPYILDVYRELFQTHDGHISVNAWNLWWPWQQTVDLRASDALVSLGPLHFTVEVASLLLLVLTTLVMLGYMRQRLDLIGLLAGCAVLAFAFYLFPMSTHERYLFPFFAFAVPLVVLRPRWLLLYVVLSVSFFLNVFFASPTDPNMSKALLNSEFGYAMSGVNVAIFLVVIAALVAELVQVRPWLSLFRPFARTQA